MHCDESVSAGKPAIMVFAAPGVHGDDVIGVHGPGVSTPSAAAVSPAVAGFAKLMHIPNGVMLRNGTKSMIVAAG